MDSDQEMLQKRDKFKDEIKIATESVIENTSLHKFLDKIQINYSTNLRNNNCKIEFGLPEYEDIFLEMMFKIGLNGDITNLVPI